MKLNDKSEVYFPSGKEVPVNEICFAAHQDDIEFMAFSGILSCIENDRKFGGVTTTNGSGSPRSGKFENCSNEDMMKIRRTEQLKASDLGKYGVQILLNHTSSDVKAPSNETVVNDFLEILKHYKPSIVYTHNLADKHDTHLGVSTKAIKAIRQLDKADRPKKLYGCEVWRGLDWVCDTEKIQIDVSSGRELAFEMMRVYESQIEGGKRYDLATDGRRYANATYCEDHEVDKASQVCYHMDLTPLIEDDSLDILDFINGFIARFSAQVNKQLGRVL